MFQGVITSPRASLDLNSSSPLQHEADHWWTVGAVPWPHHPKCYTTHLLLLGHQSKRGSCRSTVITAHPRVPRDTRLIMPIHSQVHSASASEGCHGTSYTCSDQTCTGEQCPEVPIAMPSSDSICARQPVPSSNQVVLVTDSCKRQS